MVLKARFFFRKRDGRRAAQSAPATLPLLENAPVPRSLLRQTPLHHHPAHRSSLSPQHPSSSHHRRPPKAFLFHLLLCVSLLSPSFVQPTFRLFPSGALARTTPARSRETQAGIVFGARNTDRGVAEWIRCCRSPLARVEPKTENTPPHSPPTATAVERRRHGPPLPNDGGSSRCPARVPVHLHRGVH